MPKKSKRKEKPEALDVEAASISYTDYNTIMSIQLLIDKLNGLVSEQIGLRRQMSGMREELCEVRKELAEISKYLMVPGDMLDGDKGKQKGQQETSGDSGEDSSARGDE